MPRLKGFDPDTALRRAGELFLENGYEATSVANLVEHLGIGRSSLYGTFGSKCDLYRAAVHAHLRVTQPRLLAALSRPGPALPAIRELIEGLTEEVRRDPIRHGCLPANAAVELPPESPVVALHVRASWLDLEAALTSALARGQAQGELAEDLDPSELAGFLLVMLQGVYVVARGAPDAGRLRAAVRQALAVLE
ncbi:TetR/AcrR family transcriptional regulator [Streptomyces nitrosporeus]|uniref:TetR/AcrR family transcriptional regulator n=1 Tax=Streptomyces nitrosporeus TaxID=28894 RepID=UPI00167CB515|nr:TetR/AcrR family transcriptional regulator [Streptomyces nitrosporeus]